MKSAAMERYESSLTYIPQEAVAIHLLLLAHIQVIVLDQVSNVLVFTIKSAQQS
jgi:hypothetical protein